MILSMIFLALAALCYGVTSRIQHGNCRLSKDQYDFWGNNSGRRKYVFPYLPPANSFYAKVFRLSYREKFPFSATGLVFVTDGFHLVQWFFIKFLLLSVIFFAGSATLLNFGIAWTVWCVAFNTSYILLKK